MKYKAFLFLFAMVFTFGTIALADYIEPTGSYTAVNTPDVVKTGPRATVATFEKIGIGDGTNSPDISLLSSGSYAGSGSSDKGVWSEKLYVAGVTSAIDTNSLFLVRVNNVNNTTSSLFDQYSNSVSFKYPSSSTAKSAKPVEASVAGRYISNFAITSNEDNSTPGGTNPNGFSLDLQATPGSGGFNPTTNIGLGNYCNLYPPDLGTVVGDGGGCPDGSYMTMYKAPSFSGTLSATNNTNSQIVATCREFNPSVNPTSTGKCANSKNFTDLIRIGKYVSSGNVCTFTASSGTSFTNPDVPISTNGKNVKIRWYSLGGNPARSYINTLDDQKSFTWGCGQDDWEVQIYDDYGQFVTMTR